MAAMKALLALPILAASVALGLRTMTVTGVATVGDSHDVLAFDGSSRRLYVAAESEGVAVCSHERGRRLVELGQLFLAPYAHSVAGQPQLLIMAPSSP